MNVCSREDELLDKGSHYLLLPNSASEELRLGSMRDAVLALKLEETGETCRPRVVEDGFDGKAVTEPIKIERHWKYIADKSRIVDYFGFL